MVHAYTYHPEVFWLEPADYHRRLFELAKEVVFNGGWFAFAVPRGGGKSKSCEAICEWALFHGHKLFTVLVGATQPKAITRLKNLKNEWRTNELIFADFPEITFPIRSLGRSARKAECQTCCGHPTAIEWLTEQVALPTLDEQVWREWIKRSGFDWDVNPTFGSRMAVGGITGDIRGLSVTTEDGRNIRPDLAIPDDIQTRESASSYAQSKTRLSILTGDIAFLAGPKTAMSVLFPGTVIHRGDAFDQVLDREVYPQWHGERHPMLKSFPRNMELWETYAEKVRVLQKQDKSIHPATQFYKRNRKRMDEGAIATWPSRFNSNEISALQHAMNLYFRNREAFYAEAQNEPQLGQADGEIVVCTPDEIVYKQNHCRHGVAPGWVQKVVSHIDVQQDFCWFGVGGFSDSFEGAILDYGSVPDQGRTYFTKSESLMGFRAKFPNMKHLNRRLYAGVMATIDYVAGLRFQSESGPVLQVSRINVDYGYKSDIVNRVCRETDHSAICMPVKGFGVRAKDIPFAERPLKKAYNETKGHYWNIRLLPDRDQYYGMIDANFWKSFVHVAFAAAMGDGGSLSLWKDNPARHRMFADHLNSESVVRVKVNDNEVDEWTEKPTRLDNDFFDVAYNLCAAASMEGCVMPESHQEPVNGNVEPFYAEVY